MANTRGNKRKPAQQQTEGKKGCKKAKSAGGGEGGQGVEASREEECSVLSVEFTKKQNGKSSGSEEDASARENVKLDLSESSGGSISFNGTVVGWRIVHPGSSPVLPLDAPETSSSSSSSSTNAGLDQGTAAAPSPKLELTFRSLHNPDGSPSLSGACMPASGSEAEQALLRWRAAHARSQFHKRTREVEQAVEENRVVLEKLTASEDTDSDDILPVALERQRLKVALQERRQQEEEWFSLAGVCLTFLLTEGEHVALEGVPGSPCVVWSKAARVLKAQRSEWSILHKTPLLGERVLL
jgi:hypothetical protein